MNKVLIPVEGHHSKELFPMIHNSSITDTIQWDGPESYEELRGGLRERERLMKDGKIHMFTIVDPESGKLAGSIDIRPDAEKFCADVGLWIGESFQGKGLGTKAVKEITAYGFKALELSKVESYIFTGNVASRRIFEKCGYSLEGTIRWKVKKRGKLIDEWILGILSEEYYEEE